MSRLIVAVILAFALASMLHAQKESDAPGIGAAVFTQLNGLPLYSWHLQHIELDAIYEHRFFNKYELQPFLGADGSVNVLYGGTYTGWDAWGGLVESGWVYYTHLSPRLHLKMALLAGIK